MIVLFPPLQSGVPLFLFLLWLMWLRLPILWWIQLVIVDVVVLFLILESVQLFPTENDISCGFVIYGLYHVEVVSRYVHFLDFLLFFRTSLMAYGSSQTRGQIGAVAMGLHHSHSNVVSTHWAKPGIKPASLWILVRFITAKPGRKWRLFVFYHKCVLDFVKRFFYVYWYDHMVFILQFMDVLYHTDWFADIIGSLNCWGKSHLIMLCYLFKY